MPHERPGLPQQSSVLPPHAQRAAGGEVPAHVLEAHQELFRIYSEHCPEKSEADVSKIIGKFAGREEELLIKVRRKYLG